MRRSLILIAILTPQAALAHVGHIGELAGHSHWIALGALGLATVVGALASRGGKRSEQPEDDAASDTDDEPQEAAA
jgi:hypothetical protein